jgi:SPP1 gp7 family putative phage head morphogenesis protein
VNGALVASGVRKDATPIEVREAMTWLDDIETAFAGVLPENDIMWIFDATNRYTTRGLAQVLTRQRREEVTVEDVLGIRRYELPAEREMFVATNADLIRSIDSRYLADVRKVLEQSEREQWSTEQLTAALSSRYEVSRSRAKLIAEDQISKVHGQVNQARQTALGIDSYTWRANMDRLVRPLHAERNGKTFLWSQPPHEEPGDGPPGHPINCRCFGEPEIE